MNSINQFWENRDEYPLFNLSWFHTFLWFVALPFAVGVMDGDYELARWGAALGLAVAIILSFSVYGVDHYKTSRLARAVLALVIAGVVLLVVTFGGAILIVALEVVQPIGLLAGVAILSFVVVFWALS